MFPLFESIRIKDGKGFLLEYHQLRMDFSYKKYYNKKNPWRLDFILKSLKVPIKGIYKLRIKYSELFYKCDFVKYKCLKIHSLKCIDIGDYEYSLKYVDRAFIEKKYKMKSEYDDILMIRNGFITDTSYCNIILSDGSNWFTPENPLLKGIQRENLLNKNKIFEREIRKSEIYLYREFVLVNSMIKFDDFKPISIKKIKI
ncbi:MAG: aminotransferase class IV [Flavobacteriaceae bacterium]|nr:aminotransferase class IV [Flavobacteriaceae bacterium]